jgi:hypothetical protein
LIPSTTHRYYRQKIQLPPQLQKTIAYCKNKKQSTTLSDGTIAIDTSEYQAKIISETDTSSYAITVFKINSKPFELSEKMHTTDQNQLEPCVLNKPGRNFMIKVSDKKGNMHKGYFTDQPSDDQANKYIKTAIQIIKIKNK